LDILEVLKKRRSIRKYQTKPVEKDKVLKVLEAARLGPSAANRQPCQFIVVTDENARERLRSSYNEDWFVRAPVVIVGCVNPKESWRRKDREEYWKVDAAIAMQNLILAATELGLGTCWVARFDEKAAKKALDIPKEFKIVAMTPLGYPDEEKDLVSDRKPLDALVHYDKW
jgi:nitroreductase